MRVLVTGHNGYVGTILIPMLVAAGHEVAGLDTDYFAACSFGPDAPRVPTVRMDIRDVQLEHVAGFDAIIHLAALSNDPLGNLSPACTEAINFGASVRIARLAKEARIPRFIFSSSCSLYGAAGDRILDEGTTFEPLTPYAFSKVRVEQELARLADDRFSPTFLRNATAYGSSRHLRLDLVVNNLVGFAHTTGEVVITSDGSPWRPLVHVEDICRAFLAALHAPREIVHNEAFNVGRTAENYQIRDIANIVQEIVPGSKVRYADGGRPDSRCYRVDCSKLARALPEFDPQWTVRGGVEELYSTFKRYGLTKGDLLGTKYQRIGHIRKLQDEGRLDASLRWQPRPSGFQRETASAQAEP